MEQSQVSFGNESNINKVKKSKLDEPQKSIYLRELNGHGFNVLYLTEININNF